MSIEKTARKYALLNAIRYGGKASPGAVIGRILAENPDLKDNIKELGKTMARIVQDVNKLSLEGQESELRETAPELLEKKEEKEKSIFEFMGIKDGQEITTAFPPEPSKYPHIGHAKAIILNYELARHYHGKFILRFEDTNPELAESEFYGIHLENYKWLGIEPDLVEYVSDYMDKFYNHAERLIKGGNAYICSCAPEKMKEDRREGIECGCRGQNPRDNESKWKEMFEERAGKYILRLKGDMQSPNSTMRDPVIFRVIDETHPRTKKKYRVWPNYDFENAVMDGIEGVTHRLRSKEFELRNELQRFIQKLLGFQETEITEFARFNLEGVESSGRIIREKVKSKELLGWDDPSLTTLVALKRRGFLPQAIWNFVISTGITKHESVLTWDDLISHNRKLLDADCNRYFFIENPKEITIENAPLQECELKKHPDFPQRGNRVFKTHDKFYVAEKDSVNFKDGKLIRLMDCLNFKKERRKFLFHSLEYEKYKEHGDMIIHWLPKDDKNIHVEILMPDKKIAKGVAEPSVKEIKEGDIVQFARFGFCKLDKKEKNKLHFWFTHY